MIKFFTITILLHIFTSQIAFSNADIENYKINKTDLLRIKEAFRLKNIVLKEVWPEFSNFSGTLVYTFGPNEQFIINPNQKILQQMKGLTKVKTEDEHLSIFFRRKGFLSLDNKLNKDSDVFLYTNLALEKENIHYMNPVVYIASVELLENQMPVANTEDWMNLYLHEAFHQFQFSKSNIFNNYANMQKHNNLTSSEDFSSLYKDNTEFKKNIQNEMKLLDLAIQTANKREKIKYTRNFFKLRDQRRKSMTRNLKELNKFTESEIFWETIEGGANYLEKKIDHILRNLEPNKNLIAFDQRYGAKSREALPSKKNMSKIGKVNHKYFIDTGSRIHELLAEFDPAFSFKIYDQEPQFAEGLLRKTVGIKPKNLISKQNSINNKNDKKIN